VDTVLLAAGADKSRDSLAALLKADGFSRVLPVSSGGEARRCLVQGDFDLVVINAPLSDEFGHDLSVQAAESSSAGVILLVKSELADDISAQVEDFGVLVVSKPLSRQLFYQSIKLVMVTRRRILGLKTENDKLQNKIEEIRLVNRAKCVLIQVLKLTEPQAHRYIEKQAMDLRLTRRAVAENILKTYEC
jgi:two-component system, response regulator PdtaR